MENRGHGVLGGKIEKIKNWDVDPVWLAEQLLAVDIVGPKDVEEAKPSSVSIPARRAQIVEAVRGNSREGVFQTFVGVLLSQDRLQPLGQDLKGENYNHVTRSRGRARPPLRAEEGKRESGYCRHEWGNALSQFVTV